jgi:thiamine kinase-like enzyme
MFQGCQIIFSPTNQNLQKKPNGGKTNQIFYENKPKTNHFIKNKTPSN